MPDSAPTVSSVKNNNDKGYQIRNPNGPQWVREFLAEFAGTFILIVSDDHHAFRHCFMYSALQLIGDGAVANYHLNHQMDHFAVAFTFGVAVMIGIIGAGPISGL